jgi:hypothetical protein
MPPIRVSANVEKELFEISSDFARPIEVLRESLHNSYDAGAKNVGLVAMAEKLPDGRRVLTITVTDDGQGMSGEMLDHFFGLGWTDKPTIAGREPIGFKGHGTKIYYQAAEIAVLTRQAGGEPSFINLRDARNAVYQKHLPEPQSLPPDDAVRAGLPPLGATGTVIRLRDFTPDSGNLIDRFRGGEIESYLRWFTVFGSFKHVVIDERPAAPLRLLVQGSDESNPREIEFGHRWPATDAVDLKELKPLDERRPFNFFRKSFRSAQRTIEGGYKVDIATLFEGRRGRLERDRDIARQRLGGLYSEEERYGLWLCRDYIPVEARFDWLNEEACPKIANDLGRPLILLNCQDFSLTANRGSVGNSSARLLEAVKKGLYDFIEEILCDKDLERFFNEYQEDIFSRLREKDRRALQRRVDRYNGRQYCTITLSNGKLHSFFEPTREITLFGLVSEIQLLDPALLGLEVLDYDDHCGIDLLVRRVTTPDDMLDAKKVAYVELKYTLGPQLNHTFDHLSAVICWEIAVADNDMVYDASNNAFRVQQSERDGVTHTRLLPAPGDRLQHNVTVIVLKRLLKEKCNMRCVDNPRPVSRGNGR